MAGEIPPGCEQSLDQSRDLPPDPLDVETTCAWESRDLGNPLVWRGSVGKTLSQQGPAPPQSLLSGCLLWPPGLQLGHHQTSLKTYDWAQESHLEIPMYPVPQCQLYVNQETEGVAASRFLVAGLCGSGLWGQTARILLKINDSTSLCLGFLICKGGDTVVFLSHRVNV